MVQQQPAIVVDAGDAAVHVERGDQRRVVGAPPHPPRIVDARHVLVDERDRGFEGVPQPGVDVLLRNVRACESHGLATHQPGRQRDRAHPRGDPRRHAPGVDHAPVARIEPVGLAHLLELLQPGLDHRQALRRKIDDRHEAPDLLELGQELPEDRATHQQDVAQSRLHDGIVPVLVIQPGDLPHDAFDLLPDRTEIGADRLPVHLPPVPFLLDAVPDPVAALPDEVGEPPIDVGRGHGRRRRGFVRGAGALRQRPPALLDRRYAVGEPLLLLRPPLFLAQLVELPVDTLRQLGVENRRPRQPHQVTQRSGPEQDERHAQLEPPETGEAETGHHDAGPDCQPPAVLTQPHLPHGPVIPTESSFYESRPTDRAGHL